MEKKDYIVESSRSFLDILDDETIATKLDLDLNIVKKLRSESINK